MTTPSTNLREFPRRTRQPQFLLSLSEYEKLADEYVKENFSPRRQLLETMRLSKFVLWLRKRQEMTK
jgi:hypothetical protein